MTYTIKVINENEERIIGYRKSKRALVFFIRSIKKAKRKNPETFDGELAVFNDIGKKMPKSFWDPNRIPRGPKEIKNTRTIEVL